MLDECHRPLRGRVDRVAAIVRLPDGQTVRLFAQLPDRLRAIDAAHSLLLVEDQAFQLDGGEAAAAPPATAAHLRRLRTLLDAALLGPLHRATGCQRTGPTTWDLTQPEGAAVGLELRPGTLLPARIGAVQLIDYRRTSTTWIVQRAALADLGECQLEFVFDDLDWAPDFFAPRAGTAAPTTGARLRLPATAGEPRSATPFVVEAAAARWIVVADPGGWPARAERYAPLHAELRRQDQQVAGFPILWQEDGQAWLAAPFRRRPGGPDFAPPAGWTIRDVAAGRWLVVYPPDGDLAARTGAGAAGLQAALAPLGLAADGPVLAQPFVHLEAGEPSAATLAAPVVRMSVRVR